MTNPLLNQRILCTFPGRAGDIIWALPTVRAISELAKHPVDLQIAGEFSGMVELLGWQPYLSHVCANPHWSLTPPDDWRAPDPVGTPERTYDRVYHLGYRGWPDYPLPKQTEATLHQQWKDADGEVPSIELHRPWITADPWTHIPHRLVMGWSDCHFELKYGLSQLLALNWQGELLTNFMLAAPGSRWVTEGEMEAVGWLEAAQRIAAADVFLGDCSALHVLAVALGKPCVIVEPMEARLSSIFWPLGKDGPQVTLVRGNDGEATFDARHCAETLERVLRAAQ